MARAAAAVQVVAAAAAVIFNTNTITSLVGLISGGGHGGMFGGRPR